MISEIIAQRADIEQLKTLFGRSLKVGPVEVVDAERGFRIKLGEGQGGKPYLSPFYPHPESGGATSTWAPLSKGQIVGIINPGGDARRGVLLRGGFSDENPPPSQSLEENVYSFNGVTITVRSGQLIIAIGDVTWTLSGDGEEQIGGSKSHDGMNVGKDHRHRDVMPGPGTTGVPLPL
jgi:hypothetical protein